MAEVALNKKRIFCNYCKQDTNHDLKGEHTVKTSATDWDFQEHSTYRLWICMGCEHGLLEQEYENSEMLTSDGADGIEYYSEFSYYPERSLHDLTTKQYTKLKPKLA